MAGPSVGTSRAVSGTARNSGAGPDPLRERTWPWPGRSRRRASCARLALSSQPRVFPRMAARRIGIVTSPAEKLSDYFPTAAEPDIVPTEPPFTPDDQIAVDELRRAGLAVEPVVWGHPVHLLRRYDLLVVRSPWDYMGSPELRERFVAWLA